MKNLLSFPLRALSRGVGLLVECLAFGLVLLVVGVGVVLLLPERSPPTSNDQCAYAGIPGPDAVSTDVLEHEDLV